MEHMGNTDNVSQCRTVQSYPTRLSITRSWENQWLRVSDSAQAQKQEIEVSR